MILHFQKLLPCNLLYLLFCINLVINNFQFIYKLGCILILFLYISIPRIVYIGSSWRNYKDSGAKPLYSLISTVKIPPVIVVNCKPYQIYDFSQI